MGGRAPCCDKNKVKRGSWSHAEDQKLISFISQHGHGNWRALPRLAGLSRCGKSCRLRWINYLRPDLKRGNFTKQEEDTIIELHHSLGNKWSKIASYFPGRTDNEIKNVWNTHLKKRLPAPNSSSSSSSNSSPCPSTIPAIRIGDAGEDPEISKEVPGDNEVVLFESDPDFWNRLDDLGNSSSLQEIDRLLDLDDHLDAALGDPGIIYEAMAVSHDQWVHYLEDALGLVEPARTEAGHQNLNDASTQPLL